MRAMTWGMIIALSRPWATWKLPPIACEMPWTSPRPEFWKAAGVSSSGIFRMIMFPGLKPSARFMSVGSMRTPAVLAGID